MELNAEHLAFGHVVSHHSTDRFALHCHPLYECYYFVGGDVRYLVEGVPYKPTPHSLLLMASGVFHGIQIDSDAAYERYTLHFDAALLPGEVREMLLAPFHGDTIYYTDVHAYRMADFFKAVEECKEMPQSLRAVALQSRVAALLSQVCAMRHAMQRDALLTAEDPDSLHQQILIYINAHLGEPLSLEGIARYFFISRNQLCRIFSRATGTTVGAYIRRKRLILAGQLREQGQSATEAAANAGFGDYSTYYRTHCRLMQHAPTANGLSENAGK